MDGVCHLAAEAQHGSESIGTRAHVRDGAQILEAGVLLLQRIAYGVAFPVKLYVGCLDLDCLPAAYRLDQPAVHGDACPRGDLREQGGIGSVLVDDNLYIIYGRSVVQGDERDLFVSTFGAHPALREHFFSGRFDKKVLDLRSEYFL